MKTDTIALVAIVKNETPYILEWIAHYRSIGIGNLIIYDNETDDPDGTLQKLDQAQLCKVIPWKVEEGTSPQISAYNDAIRRFRERFEFIAFFDADEFLCVPPGFNIIAWLRELPDDVGAVAINQRIFGSSGHLTRSAGFVTERFTRCSVSSYDENYWVKSIYRTDCADTILSPHHGTIRSGLYILPNGNLAFGEGVEPSGRAVHIDHETLVLNHYITKSLQEFIDKRSRGGGAGPTSQYRMARHANIVFFDGREAKANEACDFSLAARADNLRAIARYLCDTAGLPSHLIPCPIGQYPLPETMIKAGRKVLDAYLGEKLDGVDTHRLLTAVFSMMNEAGKT